MRWDAATSALLSLTWGAALCTLGGGAPRGSAQPTTAWPGYWTTRSGGTDGGRGQVVFRTRGGGSDVLFVSDQGLRFFLARLRLLARSTRASLAHTAAHTTLRGVRHNSFQFLTALHHFFPSILPPAARLTLLRGKLIRRLSSCCRRHDLLKKSPLLSFSFFRWGISVETRRRTNPHPGFSINLAHTFPFFFSSPRSTRARLSCPGSIFPTEIAYRRLVVSPCHSKSFAAHLTLTSPSPQRSAPYTPLLLARAPGRFPLLALIHLHLLHSSPRLYILFCFVWDPPACRPSPHGADQTTNGRGAVETFRYT